MIGPHCQNIRLVPQPSGGGTYESASSTVTITATLVAKAKRRKRSPWMVFSLRRGVFPDEALELMTSCASLGFQAAREEAI
jgi:hypothetical protein